MEWGTESPSTQRDRVKEKRLTHPGCTTKLFQFDCAWEGKRQRAAALQDASQPFEPERESPSGLGLRQSSGAFAGPQNPTSQLSRHDPCPKRVISCLTRILSCTPHPAAEAPGAVKILTHSLASLWLCVCGQSPSPLPAYPSNSLAPPPVAGRWPPAPARQAYSHSTSVGSRNRMPPNAASERPAPPYPVGLSTRRTFLEPSPPSIRTLVGSCRSTSIHRRQSCQLTLSTGSKSGPWK